MHFLICFASPIRSKVHPEDKAFGDRRRLGEKVTVSREGKRGKRERKESDGDGGEADSKRTRNPH